MPVCSTWGEFKERARFTEGMSVRSTHAPLIRSEGGGTEGRIGLKFPFVAVSNDPKLPDLLFPSATVLSLRTMTVPKVVPRTVVILQQPVLDDPMLGMPKTLEILKRAFPGDDIAFTEFRFHAGNGRSTDSDMIGAAASVDQDEPGPLVFQSLIKLGVEIIVASAVAIRALLRCNLVKDFWECNVGKRVVGIASTRNGSRLAYTYHPVAILPNVNAALEFTLRLLRVGKDGREAFDSLVEAGGLEVAREDELAVTRMKVIGTRAWGRAETGIDLLSKFPPEFSAACLGRIPIAFFIGSSDENALKDLVATYCKRWWGVDRLVSEMEKSTEELQRYPPNLRGTSEVCIVARLVYDAVLYCSLSDEEVAADLVGICDPDRVQGLLRTSKSENPKLVEVIARKIVASKLATPKLAISFISTSDGVVGDVMSEIGIPGRSGFGHQDEVTQRRLLRLLHDIASSSWPSEEDLVRIALDLSETEIECFPRLLQSDSLLAMCGRVVAIALRTSTLPLKHIAKELVKIWFEDGKDEIGGMISQFEGLSYSMRLNCSSELGREIIRQVCEPRLTTVSSAILALTHCPSLFFISCKDLQLPGIPIFPSLPRSVQERLIDLISSILLPAASGSSVKGNMVFEMGTEERNSFPPTLRPETFKCLISRSVFSLVRSVTTEPGWVEEVGSRAKGIVSVFFECPSSPTNSELTLFGKVVKGVDETLVGCCNEGLVSRIGGDLSRVLGFLAEESVYLGFALRELGVPGVSKFETAPNAVQRVVLENLEILLKPAWTLELQERDWLDFFDSVPTLRAKSLRGALARMLFHCVKEREATPDEKATFALKVFLPGVLQGGKATEEELCSFEEKLRHCDHEMKEVLLRKTVQSAFESPLSALSALSTGGCMLYWSIHPLRLKYSSSITRLLPSSKAAYLAEVQKILLPYWRIPPSLPFARSMPPADLRALPRLLQSETRKALIGRVVRHICLNSRLSTLPKSRREAPHYAAEHVTRNSTSSRPLATGGLLGTTTRKAFSKQRIERFFNASPPAPDGVAASSQSSSSHAGHGSLTSSSSSGGSSTRTSSSSHATPSSTVAASSSRSSSSSASTTSSGRRGSSSSASASTKEKRKKKRGLAKPAEFYRRLTTRMLGAKRSRSSHVPGQELASGDARKTILGKEASSRVPKRSKRAVVTTIPKPATTTEHVARAILQARGHVDTVDVVVEDDDDEDHDDDDEIIVVSDSDEEMKK